VKTRIFRQAPARRRVFPRPLLSVLVAAAVVIALLAVGCAKYNTYYNASKAFREAEQEREDRLKAGEEVTQATSSQRNNYDKAIKKCQKILNEYPGSGMTDDALFLMAKAHHRLAAYRTSARNIELLFANFPATPFEEEALYFQALNYLLIGDVTQSNSFLERLHKNFPDSEFRAEAFRVRGENSYVLEDWQAARESFEAYLAQDPESDLRFQAGLKLGNCLWELEDYATGAEVLRPLVEETSSREVAFNASLLLARTLSQLGQHEEASAILADLRKGAEIYQAEGRVALAEAEDLLAQGKENDAAALLQNLPTEWKTREVAPRAHDMLARIHFRRWELEEARTEFQEAVKGNKILDDPEGSRELLSILRDYLAAEQALAEGNEQREPALKLLQANALLFGMGRPRMAASRFLEVADHAEADSAAVARGLFGALVAYRDHLALPDSADLVTARLLEECPESPQAYLMREGEEADLLGYLLELQDLEYERERLRAAAEAAEAAEAEEAEGETAAEAPEEPPAATEEPLTSQPADSAAVDTTAAELIPVESVSAESAPADSTAPPGPWRQAESMTFHADAPDSLAGPAEAEVEVDSLATGDSQ